ncbi:LADA_0H19328g1_1 [Lachancea dasiensis]|uniref:LADA_0H19328g1_1 n=1 Tax=Lachancea dasiensis TaxID=1072105 RepID=A0A1G4K6B3_9SACH|nr:LADA_0H19328g1_1 [Lachancea dasiensis]
MQSVKNKWKELLYSFSTEDRYADYAESREASGIPRRSDRGLASGATGAASSSQIQLTEFVEGQEHGTNDGVSEAMLAWRHIDAWASEHHPDLYATLSEPCTRSDVSRAENDLSVSLPAAVRASFRLHDGQEDLESLTGTSGIIFGLQLMPLDQVVNMTQTWRSVAANMQKHNKALFNDTGSLSATASGSKVEVPNQSATPQTLKAKGYGKLETQDIQSANPNLQNDISNNYNKQFKLNSIPRQTSIPRDTIQPVYAHPSWIPLVTDNAGNHIAVDLAPGPDGHHGQIILFGREFDTKFVVANNWGDFLLNFANDLEKGNWYIMDGDDDYLSGEGELVFRDKGAGNTIKDYFEVLKRRAHTAWMRQEQNRSQVNGSKPEPRDISPAPNEQETTVVTDYQLSAEENATTEKESNQLGVAGTSVMPTQASLIDVEPSPVPGSASAADIESKSVQEGSDLKSPTAANLEQPEIATKEGQEMPGNSTEDEANNANDQLQSSVDEHDNVKGLKEEFENVAL